MRNRRSVVREVAERVWDTVGRYIRGILLVAFVDAVGIGLGLYLLGVPLALLVYLGALVPVVGALVSGLLAVLVAFAAGGPGLALATLVLVLLVQGIEGYVLQPLIMGRVIRLPAFVILVAVAVGSASAGVLGAFLAVPVVASIARIIEYHIDERLGMSPTDSNRIEPASRADPGSGAGPGEDVSPVRGGKASGPGWSASWFRRAGDRTPGPDRRTSG